MGDLRLWSRELLTDFIELYKCHPCLWDVKCEGYKCKYTKTLAYGELVRFCKKRGFPDANRDFVTRKLQSLRGSFRKEVRKIKKCKRQGISYQTNLWYFTNLYFTRENSNEEGNDEANDDDHQTDDEVADDNDDDNDGDEAKFSVDLTEEAKSNHSYSPPPVKRQKKSEFAFQPEFLDIGQNDRTKEFGQIDTRANVSHIEASAKDFTEFELTGMSVAKKLARMDPTQAIYAESIINSVIKKGLLKKLKEETDVCENMCGKNRMNLPSQSYNN